MIKLKNILQHNLIFILILIISIIYTLVNIYLLNETSKYNECTNNVYGRIIDYKIYDDKLRIILKAKEKLLINYYFKDDEEKNDFKLSYGDYVYIEGLFSKPSGNTNFNLFNYRKYLLSQKIHYSVNAKTISLIQKNNNILYKLKQIIVNRINKCNKSSKYIKTFIFADKSYIDNEMINNYQNLGISHLLAVSGMHVSLISLLLLKILNGINENKKYILISIILLFYLFLTSFTISMLRACFQFILLFINKRLNLNIKSTNIIILLFSILLIYNPYYIYNIGFIFSFVISFSLIKFNYLLKKENSIYTLFCISLISFLVSLPIVSNNFYQINFLSIIYNIFYVPYVSYILFPLNLLTLIFPILDNLNYIFIFIFESVSNILSNIDVLCFSVSKIPKVFIIIYYIILFNFFKKQNIKKFIMIIILIFIFIIYRKSLISTEVIYLDVGQGDSILIRLLDKNILIDTGGKLVYEKNSLESKDKKYSIANNILINYFKSSGVKKIDYLILTHGDFDHMGESINLVNNFKVDRVILNCANYNNLEQELIKVLDKKKIPYYSCVSELNIYNNKLYFLQTKEYDNENDNSNVIYADINGYKFMFMGDAGVGKERDILNEYNISNVDVLKVGHHGSKTSSSKEFIDEINPKYSIISVGKNNIYGHPKKKVLDTLSKSKIYRTDKDGSIKIKLYKNRYNIKTCN